MSYLEISDLSILFPTDDGLVKANDHLNLSIKDYETLGLIGESGSGKTVLGMAILRLLPKDVVIEGEIVFNGRNLLSLKEGEMRRVRGRDIVMILQNPSNSLNPVFTIQDQIGEVFRLHDPSFWSKDRIGKKVVELLTTVKIKDAAKRMNEYPHQFSGGMKERAIIAMALASDPSFIIADEPTKGLDITVKRAIIKLLKDVTETKSMLFITHDLEAATKLCDRIAVMYAGELLEIAKTKDLLGRPLHPYTKGFLNALPSRGLHPVRGSSPSLINPPSGCRFHPRCDFATPICEREHPPMKEMEDGRQVRCFLYA